MNFYLASCIWLTACFMLFAPDLWVQTFKLNLLPSWGFGVAGIVFLYLSIAVLVEGISLGQQLIKQL